MSSQDTLREQLRVVSVFRARHMQEDLPSSQSRSSAGPAVAPTARPLHSTRRASGGSAGSGTRPVTSATGLTVTTTSLSPAAAASASAHRSPRKRRSQHVQVAGTQTTVELTTLLSEGEEAAVECNELRAQLRAAEERIDYLEQALAQMGDLVDPSLDSEAQES